MSQRGLRTEVIMEGLLLQTVEGLGESRFPGYAGEWWELLQAEKEEITHEIAADGPLPHEAICVNEAEPEDDAAENMQRRHRNQLELRLRDLNDAQDRLIDGGYGFCTDCRKPISDLRLRVDPAVALCIACQQLADGELLNRAF
jgi:RNA polymerase-binding transcription factor DksA